MDGLFFDFEPFSGETGAVPSASNEIPRGTPEDDRRGARRRGGRRWTRRRRHGGPGRRERLRRASGGVEAAAAGPGRRRGVVRRPPRHRRDVSTTAWRCGLSLLDSVDTTALSPREELCNPTH